MWNFSQSECNDDLSNCSFVKTILMLTVVMYHAMLFWGGGGWFTGTPVYNSDILRELALCLNYFHVQAFTLVAAQATYLEVAIITLIANARYLLMSCALAQKFSPGTPFFHRLIIAYDVTDELFGITIARPGILNPYYTYGAILLAAPAWAGGTACGIIAGNALPLRAVSALSVALYGMFLAIIIPPARKSKIVAALVAISFALSFVCNYLPGVSSLSEGTRTILLTVIISGAAAILFPVKQDAEEAAPVKANDSVQKGDNVNE